MHVRALAARAFLVGAALALAPAAPAFAACDSYSGGCPSPPGDGLAGNQQDPAGGKGDLGSTGDDPTTLPFTGGELVLMTAVGAAAVAGGTGLVVAGRRRKSPAA